MQTVPCLLIPRFHRELISTGLQDHGWLDCRPWNGQAPTDQTGLLRLPLTAKQAEQCLREWQNLDADALQQELFRAASDRVLHNAGMSAAEVGAPNEFLGHASSDDGERRILAQRLLLMVWAQEERILALRALNERYIRDAQRLNTLLADPDEPLPSLSEANKDPEEARLLPPWRFVLRELKYFLPPDAILGVTDEAMAMALEATGQLRELTADERAALPEVLREQPFRGVRLSCAALAGKNGTSEDSVDTSDMHLFVLPVK